MNERHILAAFDSNLRLAIDESVLHRLTSPAKVIHCGVTSDVGCLAMALEISRLRQMLQSRPLLLTVFVSTLNSDEVSAIQAALNGGYAVACALVVLTQDANVWDMIPKIYGSYRLIINVGPSIGKRWDILFPDLVAQKRAYDVPSLGKGVAALIEATANEEYKARLSARDLGPMPRPYQTAE